MSTTTKTDDNPLGRYLKDRRAKLDPAAFGLPSTRRRTPGLRREEVAQRAFVSVTWYTWLVRSRGGAPSAAAAGRATSCGLTARPSRASSSRASCSAERGTFTVAICDRAGGFEVADGGTLFLDEVDEIPLDEFCLNDLGASTGGAGVPGSPPAKSFLWIAFKWTASVADLHCGA